MQNETGYSALWSQRLNSWPIQFEVFRPLIGTKVEESDDLFCFRVEGGKIAPFVAVAIEAGQAQVILSCFSAVLFGNDMIEFVWQMAVLVIDEAILTTSPGALIELFSQRIRNMTHQSVACGLLSAL